MCATALRALALLALLLFGCATPPPESYVRGAQRGAVKPATQVSIGKNSVGEDCTQQGETTQGATLGADVFCGTWQQPSARVRAGGPGSAAQLAQLATAGPWRSGIDVRFRCDAPVATTILGGEPAELMQCTQRVGGWAHVAMVALVDGAVWYADGVLPAAQVMERSIGVLAGVDTCRYRCTATVRPPTRCWRAARGAGVQLRRRRPVRRADGGRHARQPGGQSGCGGERLPRRPRAAAENAGQRTIRIPRRR